MFFKPMAFDLDHSRPCRVFSLRIVKSKTTVFRRGFNIFDLETSKILLADAKEKLFITR